MTWNVGTGNTYTQQSNIAVSDGSARIGAIHISNEVGEYDNN